VNQPRTPAAAVVPARESPARRKPPTHRNACPQRSPASTRVAVSCSAAKRPGRRAGLGRGRYAGAPGPLRGRSLRLPHARSTSRRTPTLAVASMPPGGELFGRVHAAAGPSARLSLYIRSGPSTGRRWGRGASCPQKAGGVVPPEWGPRTVSPPTSLETPTTRATAPIAGGLRRVPPGVNSAPESCSRKSN